MKAVKLGGVPLHPALVHFPIAAWSLVLVTDVVFFVQGGSAFWAVSYWALMAGVISALLAMAAGFMDFMSCDPEHPAADKVQTHLMLMGISWSLFLFDLILRSREAPDVMPWWLLALTLAGFLLLLAGGHIGARLVYVHGISVEPRA